MSISAVYSYQYRERQKEEADAFVIYSNRLNLKDKDRLPCAIKKVRSIEADRKKEAIKKFMEEKE